ncbi:MAG: hypothetical protein KIT33_15050 [Candidatus Kapabacteria bacterium]|nr:hypothetical protein [Ignavibacteriota bacterium]MCW5886287.1 hypothetical protein [Candidatus Kapabacteria bacterium]
MKKNIKIAFMGFNWGDLTNDKMVGSPDEVINYVNTNRLKVDNENSFKYKERFWYNQPIPELEYLNNYNLNNLYKDGPENVCNILSDNGVKVSKDIVKVLSQIYQDIQKLHDKMLNASLTEFLADIIKNVQEKPDNMESLLKNYFYDVNLISEAASSIDISYSNQNIISDIVYEKKHILKSINIAVKELISTVQELYPDYETNHDYHYEYYENCLSCELEQVATDEELRSLNYDYEKMCV